MENGERGGGGGGGIPMEERRSPKRITRTITYLYTNIHKKTVRIESLFHFLPLRMSPVYIIHLADGNIKTLPRPMSMSSSTGADRGKAEEGGGVPSS